jgi:uncharacterized protein (TIGR02147 family)
METPYYLKKLREQFSRRQRGNHSYSLRAFARDLKIHPSTLSLVMLGKRPLPLKDAAKVLNGLGLNAKERTLFNESLGKKHLSLDKIQISATDDRAFLDEETYFQVIAEWEHYAVLTLFDCDDFEPTPANISKALKVSVVRAEVVLENLLRYGLVKKSEHGILSKAFPRVRTTEDIASEALKASHQDTLVLSQQKLKEVPVELRDFSSLTVAIDLEKLTEAKTIIREFRQKMGELLKTGHKTDVYQLAVQFFPLTQATVNPVKRDHLGGQS